MGFRLSPADAVARALITQDEADKITRGMIGRRSPESIALLTRNASPPIKKQSKPPAAAQLAACLKKDNEIPQRRLYEALCAALPGIPEWEREGLIPGRLFRADVYLPQSCIVVELDGFGFHRSKEAFQSDRRRSNLFTLHGYRMIHAYTKQVMDDGLLAELVSLIVQAHNTPLATARLSIEEQIKTPAL